jgi:hypothetical protein
MTWALACAGAALAQTAPATASGNNPPAPLTPAAWNSCKAGVTLGLTAFDALNHLGKASAAFDDKSLANRTATETKLHSVRTAMQLSSGTTQTCESARQQVRAAVMDINAHFTQAPGGVFKEAKDAKTCNALSERFAKTVSDSARYLQAGNPALLEKHNAVFADAARSLTDTRQYTSGPPLQVCKATLGVHNDTRKKLFAS